MNQGKETGKILEGEVGDKAEDGILIDSIRSVQHDHWEKSDEEETGLPWKWVIPNLFESSITPLFSPYLLSSLEVRSINISITIRSQHVDKRSLFGVILLSFLSLHIIPPLPDNIWSIDPHDQSFLTVYHTVHFHMSES